MTVNSLQGLLQDVRDGRAVEWPRLLSALSKRGVPTVQVHEAMNAVRYTDKVYHVEVINWDIFDSIADRISQASDNSRKSESARGDTHRVNVDGALLVSRTLSNPHPYNHCFGSGIPLPTPEKKNALIIENLECFLDYRNTYRFAAEYCGLDIPETDIEFIWAAGNSVSNRLIIPYLNQLEGSVFCLFDVDLGGLRIFANLLSGGIKLETTHYLAPRDLEDRLAASNRKVTNKEMDNLKSVFGYSAMTDTIITLIRHHQRTIEQESYRADF